MKLFYRLVILISIILVIYLLTNDEQEPKYTVYDIDCNVVGEYEIKEYDEILEENSTYKGYCIKDLVASTTTLRSSEENPFKNISINIDGCLVESNINDNPTLIEEIFVVGHAYGTPGGTDDFFPKTLLNYLKENSRKELSGIALTGDFVRENSLRSFQKVHSFIEENFSTYFIAVGNHEVVNNNKVSIENYNQIFKKDLFIKDYSSVIVISANFSNENWLPSKVQIEKINEAILNSKANYIILLTHQIFWQEETGGELEPNSYALLNTDLPYDSLNWLNDNEKNIVIISGDYGAFGQETYCIQKYNKMFIANGIGGLETDTLIKLSIYDNYTVIDEVLISSG